MVKLINHMSKFVRRVPNHMWVAMSGWLSRLIVVPAQLITIPVFYQKLGLQNFAVFTVITSLTSWYALVDFGVGTSLQNYISEYRAEDKNPAILLTKVFPLIVSLLVIILAVIALLGGFLQKWLFSNINNPISIFHFDVIIILYCWFFIFGVSGKVFFAYKKGFLGYFYQSIAYVIILLLVLGVHLFDLQLSLVDALYIWVLPLFLSALWAFLHAYCHAGAKFLLFSWDKYLLSQLGRRAFYFWLISLSAVGVVAIDYVIIVKLLSAEDVVIYSIASKIFIMMLFTYSVVLTALWPSLAERYAKKTLSDNKEAEHRLQKTIVGGMIYMLLATLSIVFFRNIIVNLFRVKTEINLSITVILLFGVYGCIRVWSDTYAVVLQSRSLIRIFIIQTPIQALISILAMLMLAKFHLIGIMLALIISFLVPALSLPWYHYKTIKVNV